MTTSEWQVEGTLAFAQRAAVIVALRDNGCNLTHAARQLRIGRTTLYRLIKRFELDVTFAPETRARPSRRRRPEAQQTSVRLVDGIWYLVKEGANDQSRQDALSDA